MRAGHEFDGRGVAYRVTVTTVAILAVGALDSATGPHVAFSVFYLLPVSLAACCGQRWVAVGSCALAALTWWGADAISGGEHVNWLVAGWNATSRFIVFVIVASLLGTLRSALGEAEMLGRNDPLTGAANARHFFETAEKERLRAARTGRPLSVMYIDLDDFKAVNDSHGHLVGDEVLRAVAGALMGEVRDSDVVGRLGGDEFAVLLPETDHLAAEAVAAKLQAALRNAFVSLERTLSASFGVASFSEPPPTFDDLLGVADRLMYEAKAQGKDTVRTVALG